jgi:nucleoid-associated protein YgaU
MLFEAGLRSSLLQVAGTAAALGAALFVADVVLGILARAGVAARTAETLRRVSPPLIRHVAELAATALLTLGAARPAAASPTPVRDWLHQSTATTTTVPTTSTTTTATTTTAAPRLAPHAPSPTPATTPTAVPAPAPAPTSPSPARPLRPAPEANPATDHYVVEPGDCLWRIAARRLGPGATNQAIDSAWRAIYAANRAGVGDDPNLIHPGLALMLPPLPIAR